MNGNDAHIKPPPGWDVFEAAWTTDHFLRCRERYSLLLKLFTHDVSITSAFCKMIERESLNDVASFINVIVQVSSQLNTSLCCLIKNLLRGEISKHTEETKGAILRGNSPAILLQRAHLRLVGRSYVASVLGPLISQIVNHPSLDLEVDATKMNPIPDEETILANAQELENVCQQFIDHITIVGDDDSGGPLALPREIRAIASYTSDIATEYFPEQQVPLIGGYLLLRFICPVLVAPESWIPSLQTISAKSRRHLILISKVLQNLSNGLFFGTKEAYLLVLNPLLRRNMDRMKRFLLHSTMDDRVHSTKPWEDLEAPNPELCVDNVDMDTLFVLHRYFCQYSGALISRAKEDEHLGEIDDDDRVEFPQKTDDAAAMMDEPLLRVSRANLQQIIDLALSIGTPPPTSSSSSSPSSSSSSCGIVDASFGASSLPLVEVDPTSSTDKMGDDDGDGDPPPSGILFHHTALGKHSRLRDTAQFLYKGPPNALGQPVYYLIVSRVKMEYLQDTRAFLSHVLRVMSGAETHPYAVVVDMSWARPSLELQRILYSNVKELYSTFTRQQKKNLKAAYIVHPTSFTRWMLFIVLAFTSRKLKKKVHELYSWEELHRYIDPANVALPESSKDVLSKSYSVVKVNARGKSQRRLIKFTRTSLLNIDPRYHTIQNEKPIAHINELRIPLDANELLLSFVPGGDKHVRGGLLGRMKSTNVKDDVYRRYVCEDAQQRDEIVRELFVIAFRHHAAEAGKHHEEPPNHHHEYNITLTMMGMGMGSEGKGAPLPISTADATSTTSATPSPLVSGGASAKTSHHKFMVKFTVDSMLLLDANFKIKSETSFAGIQSVSTHHGDGDEDGGGGRGRYVMLITPKSLKKRMQITCQDERQCEQMASELKDGMSRYAMEQEEWVDAYKEKCEYEKQRMEQYQMKLKLLREAI